MNRLGPGQILPVTRNPASSKQRNRQPERSTTKADPKALRHLLADQAQTAATEPHHAPQPLVRPRSTATTSRFETFRQAISSMHPTAHSRTINGVLMSLTTSSIIGRNTASSATGFDAFASCNRYCNALTSCVAVAALTPGRSRAMT